MWRWILVVVMSGITCSIAACTPFGLPTTSPPTPDARATEARIAMNIFATLTASVPTPSSAPTITSTRTRANTPTVKSTPRPTATRPPTSTPRPAPTSTPVPLPTVDLFADKSLPEPIAKNAPTNLEGKWEITHVGDFRDKTVFNDLPDLVKTAAGVWVTAQFRIRNLQPAITYLGRDYRFTAIDQYGRTYDEDSGASRNAGWQYCGCSAAYDDVQPGQETVIVVSFDMPSATKTLVLAVRQGWSNQLMPTPRFRIIDVDQIPAWKPKSQ